MDWNNRQRLIMKQNEESIKKLTKYFNASLQSSAMVGDPSILACMRLIICLIDFGFINLDKVRRTSDDDILQCLEDRIRK